MALKKFFKRWFSIRNPFADDPIGDLGTNDLKERMEGINKTTVPPIKGIVITAENATEETAYKLGLEHAKDHGSVYGTDVEVTVTRGERKV